MYVLWYLFFTVYTWKGEGFLKVDAWCLTYRTYTVCCQMELAFTVILSIVELCTKAYFTGISPLSLQHTGT